MTAWDLNRAALRHHLKTDKLEDFLRWSTIESTMFVGDVSFVRKEYDELFHNGVNPFRSWQAAMIEPGVGNPKLLWGWTSGNLIHQLYHLKQWLDRSGPPSGTSRGRKTVDQLSSIFEFGAGYGAMCLICRRLGFTGRYFIYDFPEMREIQNYYLKNTVGLDNVTWFSIDERDLPDRCDLFIAIHSLSETPVDDREAALSSAPADAYLFASSYEFEGVDNETWLQRFAGGTVGYDWAQWAHPYQENALYQVGVRL